MTEKLASAEIAESRERFRKYLVDQPCPFDRQAVIAAMQWTERDTRERIALEIKEMTRRWRGNPLIAADWIAERICEGKG